MYNYYYIPCDRIKKNRVGENGGLNQSKPQSSTIQVTRFFYSIPRYKHGQCKCKVRNSFDKIEIVELKKKMLDRSNLFIKSTSFQITVIFDHFFALKV
jgi:hypothetical protein